ncbi:hypothetical protein Taro_024367 [Colocasia esculenta]|uniref:alpha,alpha-trehalose-phosphate synthase (UDP-forming) n=1 Tax=Colocasia esculenta TaxID=4460 RepID=A0A843V792_COLES|nr:hypothetical protein [Colocasia esculenta]
MWYFNILPPALVGRTEPKLYQRPTEPTRCSVGGGKWAHVSPQSKRVKSRPSSQRCASRMRSLPVLLPYPPRSPILRGKLRRSGQPTAPHVAGATARAVRRSNAAFPCPHHPIPLSAPCCAYSHTSSLTAVLRPPLPPVQASPWMARSEGGIEGLYFSPISTSPNTYKGWQWRGGVVSRGESGELYWFSSLPPFPAAVLAPSKGEGDHIIPIAGEESLVGSPPLRPISAERQKEIPFVTRRGNQSAFRLCSCKSPVVYLEVCLLFLILSFVVCPCWFLPLWSLLAEEAFAAHRHGVPVLLASGVEAVPPLDSGARSCPAADSYSESSSSCAFHPLNCSFRVFWLRDPLTLQSIEGYSLYPSCYKMVSRSYSNLLELTSGDSPSFGRVGKRLPRVMTVAGIISDLDDENSNSVGSDAPSSVSQERVIIVGNQLPIRAHKRPDDDGWNFSWDEDSLLLQLKDGLGEDTEVIYIGCLKEEIDQREQDNVSQTLLETFKCVPTFLPPDLFTKFYHGFCKQHLWPLFHYMLPLSQDLGGRFDRSLWQAYVSVNKIFADRVMEVLSPDDDFVWVHDYHLMVLPTFLRKRFNRVKLGFFLHSPFPSSEIYRTLPVRDELLRALLNSDLIGFHTFDYARHFLSCCSRMLGLSYHSKRGYVGLEYYGRTVSIKILPVGIHMGQLQSVLNFPDMETKVAELKDQFKDRIVLLGVDDMDIFKGISLKLLAMEQLLIQHPDWRGKVVLVQIANPARGRGKDVQEVQTETYSIVTRINEMFGRPGYKPVVFIDRPLQFYERIAYYVIAECCLVTAVRDGMNLIPYEYIISRQGNEKLDEVLELSPSILKKSMLVVSEFIGCSPSLSGAIRVNPWNIDAVAEAMDSALVMPEPEKQLRHEKHYRYVSTHHVRYWAHSFLQDLERTCRDHVRRRCWGIGFGLGFRVIVLDPNFRKLSVEHIVSAYKRTRNRAILLDYDGTMTSQTSINKMPTAEVIGILNSLCRDPKNVVFLVSGRDKKTLREWFSSCENLGVAAEHGYFFREKHDQEWETCVPVTDFDWKLIAEPVMKLYVETTDGSTIEAKESALVWHYQYADPDFGSCQAKELLDHLESVLSNEPVSVKSGQHIVEVKPQGVTKGLVAERLLSTMKKKGMLPDFVLCIGDDRSDEDMFEVITSAVAGPSLSPVADVFACTVGQKPSKAKYYLEDTTEIVRMLQGLAIASDQMMKNTASQSPP